MNSEVQGLVETAPTGRASRLQSSGMRWGRLILAVTALTVAAFAVDEPQTVPIIPCGQGDKTTPGCNPSKKELKEAKAAYAKGMELQKDKRTDQAFEQFDTAAKLSPRNVDYVTMREMARQQLVFDHLERGNAELLNNHQIEALAEFRSALQLDPENQFAQQRLGDALGEWAPKMPATPVVLPDAGEVRVVPNQKRAEFHYRGDARGLLEQVAGTFGVTATFDDSVITRQARFDIDSVDFYTAMRAVCDVTKTFWTPLGGKQILLAADTAENRRQFDRMGLRTFYVPGVSDPKDMNDIVNMLRQLFEIRFVTPEPQNSTIVVRAPQRTLDAATQLMESLGDSRPQVMLDVNVYEISHSLMRNLGMHIPNQFQLFNIPAGALAALGGQSIQDLVNQLIAGGGINQAGSQGIAALLAQLQSQQNSIFSQPLATFGGGLTFMGLSLGTASTQLSLNESSVKSLEHAYLRASQGNQANLHVGSRYPILNASFAPIFNTPAIAQVIQNNSFQAAFPSFNYEDLGLTVKAKPLVNANLDVRLELEMQIRSLGTTSLNGVPVISNREYKGSITIMDGTQAVVAGSVSSTEQRSLSGIPGLGQVPGLNKITATNSKQEDENELLVVITPHVVSSGSQKTSELWLTK
jgi:general secretion pathway protein D